MNLKQHKKGLILSSIVILLPILFGVVFWDQFPKTFVTHFGISGEADGYSSKAFAVFCPPLILLSTHWLCILITMADKRQKRQNKKVTGMILWIMPSISIFVNAMMYGIALGKDLNPLLLISPLLGLMFIFIGNYMPKCTQNSTIGIKIPWTLANEENWNVTHRLAGKLWVGGGVLILLCSFLPENIAHTIMFLMILPMVIIPIFYSWQYYRKQVQAGTAIPVKDIPVSKSRRITTAILIVLTLIFLCTILFTGQIRYTFEENYFIADATYHEELMIAYDAIEDITLVDHPIPGTRTIGFASLRLLLGSFQNEEFGNYLRYTYYNPDCSIILTVNGDTIVISGETARETETIYLEICSHMA